MTGGHINWGRFSIYHCNDADLDEAPDLEFPFIKGSRFRAVNTGIDEPGVQVNYEDFVKGKDIVWTLAHDEIHYVVSGECEIEYHLPPLMLESGKAIARAGSVYFMPRGLRIVWRTLSEEPFRHLCICVPNPGYPIPVAASNRTAHARTTGRTRKKRR
jgi:mannose-6-phosphate isomerase-like protein (cupin superfamily)